ncbi:MAG: DUF192 domain-containing protein [Cyanobacteria bacterium P01_H01_bin.121]
MQMQTFGRCGVGLLLTLAIASCAALPSNVAAEQVAERAIEPDTTLNEVLDETPTAPQNASASIQASNPQSAQMLPISARVQLGDQLINLEVTRTLQEQALGLMFRQSLADDRGMLFQFSPARPVRFWMKNVVIDLDMVFVRDNQIVAIAANVPPCATQPCPTYGPPVPVDSVIELRGGRASELQLQPGDPVDIQFLP